MLPRKDAVQLSLYSMIVIDSYKIPDSLLYQQTLYCVFDYGQISNLTLADVIINPADSPIIKAKVKANTTMLIGKKFRLLRSEFSQIPLPNILANDSILVTLGGGTHTQLTNLLITKLIKELPNIDLTIVTPSPVTGMAAEHSRLSQFTNVENMSEMMSRAKIAISAAGGTLYELCSLGVPTIALIIADNQNEITNGQQRHLVSVYDCRTIEESKLDDIVRIAAKTINNDLQLETISKRASTHIDRLGAKRVADELLSLLA